MWESNPVPTLEVWCFIIKLHLAIFTSWWDGLVLSHDLLFSQWSAGWDSNPRFQLPATCIDDISIQRYLPIIKKPSQFTDWVRIFNERVKTYPISIMGLPPAIAPFPMIDMLLTAFIFILILSYTNIY